MNRPTPHIGQTMQQRRALAHYVPMAAQAQAERIMREERDRQAGAELLARIRLHDLSGCALVEYQPPLLSRFVASLRRSFGRWWPVAVTVWAAYVGVGVVAAVACVGAWV